MGKVLLIEDDEAMRLSIKQSLEIEDIQVVATTGFEQAKSLIRLNFAGIVLTDIRMPRFDGFDVLQRAQDVDADLPVILISGEADVPMAISAMKKGAYDFIEKPCPTATLLEAVQRALKQRQSTLKSRRLERQLISTDIVRKNFPGECIAIRDFRRMLRANLQSEEHVALHGEEGAGKRLAADCLLQARQELGETKHIVLAAQDECKQLNNQKDLATLCLHNYPKFSAENLACVARFANENPDSKIVLLGRSEELVVSFPFFEAFETINVPNLKERASDLAVIFEANVRQIEQSYGVDFLPIAPEIVHRVTQGSWNGNLQELRQFARAYVLGGHNAKLDTQQTHASMMQDFEKLIIAQALKSNGGNATDAANSLGLPRKTFYDRMKKLSLSRNEIMQQ